MSDIEPDIAATRSVIAKASAVGADHSAAPSLRFTLTPRTRGRLRAQKLAHAIFGAMAVAMLIPLFSILVYLVVQAMPSLNWAFLTEPTGAGLRSGGIWPALVGTLYLVFFSLLVAAPIGVMAGIYLNEIARESWFTRVVNLAVVNLAGVPSVIHGLFGVMAFVYFAGMGKSILASSMTLAIMTLPVIIVATKEALAAVPIAFREACWNVGASKWQVIRTIVLPNSVGGILTGLILEVCRAAGETAPIIFTGVALYKFVEPGVLFPYKPTEQCMALSYHLWAISTQAAGVPESMKYAAAVVLVGFVLVFNSFAIALRIRLRARKKW